MDALMIIRGVRGVDDGVLYPDGTVFSLQDFQAVEPAFTFPEGVVRIEYIPGKRLSYITQDGQFGPDFPFEGVWDIGDKILASRDAYQSAIEALRPPPPPPPQPVDRHAALKQSLDDMLADQAPNLLKIRSVLAEMRKTLVLAATLFVLSSPVWGMEHFTRPIQDQNGRAIVGAVVTVYSADTSTLATIYSDNGITAKANPFTTGIDGLADFYAANGRYDITIKKTGYPSAYFDPLKMKGVALTDPTGITAGGGGSNAVGPSGAVQSSDGVGGLADSGCTGSSGALSCITIELTGGGIGSGTFLSGPTPQSPTSAGEVTYFFDSGNFRLGSIANGGTVKNYVTELDPQTLSNKLVRHSYLHTLAGCWNGTPGPVWNIPASNAAVPACDIGTNKYSGYLSFNDTTDQGYQEEFILQNGYSGGIDWQVRYKMAAATSGTVGVCVRLVRVPVGASSDPSFPAQSTSNCASQTVPGTAGFEADLTISNVLCSSCVAGDKVAVLVERDANGSAVSDTATGDMRMIYSGPKYSSVE